MTETSAGRSATTRNAALGAYGERVAETHVRQHGFVVLDRNWCCDQGEIDLVLRDGAVLVVCEVKTRTNFDHGSPHEAITDVKLRRLQRLGRQWSETHHVSPPEIRVDLVAVLRPAKGAALVEHVKGIG